MSVANETSDAAMTSSFWRTIAFLGGALLFLLATSHAEQAPGVQKRVPVIDITDLYHPHQDVGDNVDLIAAYALPEVDLRAVIFDVSEAFRHPVARHPELPEDRDGPREAGFIPVQQLNAIFNRTVPAACAPFAMMHSPDDRMLDAPPFQQQGIELLLRTLRESSEPMEVVSFGSARPLAVAYNREPKLLEKKIRRVHLSAGSSSTGFREWNVLLDPNAFIRLMRSKLPIALYPCATRESCFAVGRNNTFWKLSDLQFIARMDPKLQRYLVYAFTRSSRSDFLRFLDEETQPDEMAKITARPHNVWESAIWLNVSSRKLVQHKDGTCRIVAAADIQSTDRILPNDLRPCRIQVNDKGDLEFELVEKRTNLWIYDRGDAAANERALREAFPQWYLSIRP